MANTRAQKTAQNLSTLTTAGDIAYASAAGVPARLGIGSTSQVLTVAAGVPSWAAAASGAMTLIKAETAFTTVANTGTTFDGVFSSAYNNYLIVFDQISTSVDGADINFQMRYAGPTTEADAVLTGAAISYNHSGSLSNWYMSNATATKIGLTQSTATRFSTIELKVAGFDSGTAAAYRLTWNAALSYNMAVIGGVWRNNNVAYRVYTGFIITPASGTISGRCTVYGLAKA